MYKRFVVLRMQDRPDPHVGHYQTSNEQVTALSHDAEDIVVGGLAMLFVVDTHEDAEILVQDLSANNPGHRYMILEMLSLHCPVYSPKLSKFVFNNNMLTPCA